MHDFFFCGGGGGHLGGTENLWGHVPKQADKKKKITFVGGGSRKNHLQKRKTVNFFIRIYFKAYFKNT